MRLELLLAVFLDLETKINTAKEMKGLLHFRVILWINFCKGDEFVSGNPVALPIIQDVEFVHATVHTTGEREYNLTTAGEGMINSFPTSPRKTVSA